MLNDKVKSIENDLELSKIQLKIFSSDKLDCLLNSQKPCSDKRGLGYKYVVSNAPSTSDTPPITKGKIAFVPASSNKVIR
jgi:hypothetical protein